MKTNRKIGMLLACLAGVCLFISQARAAVVVAIKSTRYNGVGAWVADADPPLTWNDATFEIPAGGPPGKLVVMIAGEGNPPPFTVTWNDTALDLVAGTNFAGSVFVYVFALDYPTSGTGPLVVTKGGGLTRYGVAALYATGVGSDVQFGLAGKDNASVLSATTPGNVPSGGLVVSIGGHSDGPGGMTTNSGIQSVGAVQFLNTDQGLGGGSSAGADYLTNIPGGTPLTATWTEGVGRAQNMAVAIVAFGTRMRQAPTAMGVTTQIQSATVYSGREAAFSFVTTNNGFPQLATSYRWYKNNQVMTNATGTQFTFLAVPNDNGANVYCLATPTPALYNSNNLSLYSATGTVTVLPGVMYTNGLKVEFFSGSNRQNVEAGNVGPATTITVASSFESPVNFADNYARRVSGWFIPPASGNYVFFVCSDDDSDLFLSTDSNLANKRLIAQETAWSNSRQWISSGGGSILGQKRSDQWSPDGGATIPYAAGIPLTAGQLYYLEGVHHEGNGGDDFAATFKLIADPDPVDGDAPNFQAASNNIVLITSPVTNLSWVTQPANVAVFGGQNATLKALATSDSEFAILYQWRREGTNVPGATSATYQFLTSVSDNNSHWSLVARTAEGGLAITSSVATITVLTPVFEPGWAVMEYWTGQAGASHDALLPVENGTAGDPAFTMAVPAFEAGVNNENGDNFVNRIRGLFVPPATASYVFFVCGDDQCDLFLSTDDTPANKRLIAQETGWSDPRRWVTANNGLASMKRSDQWSPDGGVTVPYASGIALTAGQKYWLEAVHTEGGGGDSVEVNYMRTTDPDPDNLTPSALTGSVIGFNAPISTNEAFTLQPVSMTVTSGFTATFTAAGTSDSPFQLGNTGIFFQNGTFLTFPKVMFQWYSNNVAIPGATATSYTTPLTLPTNNGDQYSCRIRALGIPTWSNSLPATLTVITDTNVPTILYAATHSNVNLSPVEQYIDVAFTMRMDAATLGAISTYSVPGVTITAVTVNTKNYRSVRLSYTGTLTLPASVTVNGARSFSGIPVNGTPTSPIQQVPLTSLDIGTPGADPVLPSTMFVDGVGAYTIIAEGSDIWNNADGFNFTYEIKTNDFDVVVRQKSITHTSNWAKGGLMARETLDAGSRNWNIVNDPLASDGIAAPDGSGLGASVVECNSRVTADGPSAGWDTSRPAPVYPNAWVRLKRTGQVFTAYNSTNGVTWNLQGTQDPTQVGSSNAMPTAIFVGLCVTAHNNDAFGTLNPLYLNTVEFADYNSNYVPPAPRAGLVATRSGGDLVISWAPTGGHLESSLALGPAASWSTVGTANPATVPITGAAKFFRVVNP